MRVYSASLYKFIIKKIDLICPQILLTELKKLLVIVKIETGKNLVIQTIVTALMYIAV